MGRLLFWLAVIGISGWIIWVFRRRLRVALRILAVVYPVLLAISLIQGGFDTDRLLLLLAMIAVGAAVFWVNRVMASDDNVGG